MRSHALHRDYEMSLKPNNALNNESPMSRVTMRTRCKKSYSCLVNTYPITTNSTQLRWPSGKSVRLWNCKLGFDSESDQTDNFKIAIYSFLASHFALKGQCGE